MKLVRVLKHCSVRFDRRAGEHRLSRTDGVTVLVWKKSLGRYVLGHRSILEAACPVCRARRGLPCRGGADGRGDPHGWTHWQRRRAATAGRRDDR